MDDGQQGIKGDKTDGEAVAVKSSQSDVTIYRMDKETRGLALIINNHHFQKSSGMKEFPRPGTDKDRDALIEVFKMLKFKVKPYDNQTTSETKKLLKKLADKKHVRYDAIAVAILSHGDENVIYSTDGRMDLESISKPFRGLNLAGKPKIFIFQACRGRDYMDGVDVTDSPWKPKPSNRVQAPVESDFIYAYSTVPGYFSWRNSTNGSWFIQSVARVFTQHAHEMDIVRMLTRVNQAVATFKSQTDNEESCDKMQVSTIVSTLRKDLYFFPENVLDR